MAAVRLAAPALLLLLAGCWVPLERGRQMDARIARLEVETREQARTIDELVKEKLAQVDRKLAEVQQKLDELNTVSRAKGADLGVQVGRLQEELRILRGDLETQQHQLGQVDAALKAGLKELDVRLESLKGTGALDEAQARQRLADLGRPDDKGAVWALAQKEDGAGNGGVALVLYQHYVKRWPRGEKAAEAGLRAGQLLSGQARWREAVVALGAVAADHPKAEQAAPALLLMAEALVKLERKEDARAFLEQVVAEHPKSELAAKAKARLAELFPPAKDAKKPPPKKK